MLPPPPGLFSTIAVCLSRSCKPVAISRPTTSLEPPGVNGMMIRIVLFGKPCALAVEIKASAATKAASSRVMLTPWSREVCAPRSDIVQVITLPQRGAVYQIYGSQRAHFAAIHVDGGAVQPASAR